MEKYKVTATVTEAMSRAQLIALKRGRGIAIAGGGGSTVSTTAGADVSAKLDRAEFDELFERVVLKEGEPGESVAIRAKYGFYSDSFISAGGVNSDIPTPGGATSGGMDEAQLAAYLANNNYCVTSYVDNAVKTVKANIGDRLDEMESDITTEGGRAEAAAKKYTDTKLKAPLRPTQKAGTWLQLPDNALLMADGVPGSGAHAVAATKLTNGNMLMLGGNGDVAGLMYLTKEDMESGNNRAFRQFLFYPNGDISFNGNLYVDGNISAKGTNAQGADIANLIARIEALEAKIK